MKIIESNLLPPRGYKAITLFGYCFTRSIRSLTGADILHELIHAEQQREMLYLPFFLWYGLEYLVGLLWHGDHRKAYRSISFEREAYQNQHAFNYLGKRPAFAWLAYFKI